MVYKGRMGFVCLNTRYEKMRHLMYASHNGIEKQKDSDDEGTVESTVYTA